ncbi:hypothetical protein BDV18DRAFT_141791 [Aspergillus unguis]
MHFTTITALTLTALTPLVSAVGNAKVHNNCPDPVYVWSVGGSVSEAHKVESGSTYSEQFYRDPSSGGVSLKVARTANGLYDGSPQLNYAYTLDPTQVWYDLSTVFGSAFEGEVLSVTSSNEGCPSICWPEGTQPAGSQVKTCEPTADETLTLCAEECPA